MKDALVEILINEQTQHQHGPRTYFSFCRAAQRASSRSLIAA